jgi:hypothetical protein
LEIYNTFKIELRRFRVIMAFVMQKIIRRLFCVLTMLCAVQTLCAQGTAFTYQGRLNDGGSPATGNYDLRFQIYDALTNGNIVSLPLTNSATTVNNGLFTTVLDFGPGIFTGPNRWLDISVRTNGTPGAFTLLSPRQPVLPAPYAIFANTASNLLGTLAAAQLSGTLPASAFTGYTNTVALTNSANLFSGTFNGTFSGNGANLVNLNASQLTGGTVADARLSTNVALLNGTQTFSGVNTFTNFGNSFRGSFFGNGLVGWISANGTAIQAVIDTGYLLTNSQLVTVTLPSSPSPGDIVRISGAGARGWQIKGNSGQSLLGNFASYGNIYQVSLQSSTFYGNYGGVAASVDGSRMYAVGSGITGVSASSDFGRTWSQTASSFSLNCQSVACSANGRIVYAVTTAGVIWMSSNSGSTWSSISGSTTTIACTADGSAHFTGGIACSGNGNFLAKLAAGAITISTNGGSTFNVAVAAPAAGVTCLAVSSDCTRLVAGVNGGLLYGSANVGATWTAITTTNQFLAGAWMSGDGSKFATAVNTASGVTGGIFNYAVSVLPGTVGTNSIAGSQSSAVELQYIGNGKFMPVSSAGTIWAN